MKVEATDAYKWKDESTYIHKPPYFKDIKLELNPIPDIKSAYCLANFGDFITTDHISPAGSIAANSPAAKYLLDRGV